MSEQEVQNNQRLTEDELDFDHLDPASRLTIMEKKYKVVEDHTVTVSKLSAKVSLLLTLMSFAVVIVSGAAVYTFNGLNNFKDHYAEDRLGMHQLINETQIKNRQLIQESIHTLDVSMGSKIEGIEHNLDTKIEKIEDNMEERMNDIEIQYTELKEKIKK